MRDKFKPKTKSRFFKQVKRIKSAYQQKKQPVAKIEKKEIKKILELKPVNKKKVSEIKNELKDVNKQLSDDLKKKLKQVLAKQLKGGRLTKVEKESLEYFKTLKVLEKVDKDLYKRYWKFDFKDSLWMINGYYDTWTKMCFLFFKRGKGAYTFFNVPKTKMLDLITVGSGELMWDYFGRRYSINPTRWIRKGTK